MRCQSDFCCVAAERTTRSSFFEDRLSDRQFTALPSRTSLFILHEWGSAPSNSPVAAVFRYSTRMGSVSEVFLESGLTEAVVTSLLQLVLDAIELCSRGLKIKIGEILTNPVDVIREISSSNSAAQFVKLLPGLQVVVRQ
jgi:hypothetical protein